jgi:hypothetical protein
VRPGRSRLSSDLLLAISEHAKREAIAALGIPGDHIVVVHGGTGVCFRPVQLSPTLRHLLRSRYGIGDRDLRHGRMPNIRPSMPSIDTSAGAAALDVARQTISVEEDSEVIIVVMLITFR